MAQLTIEEDITDLEARIELLDTEIKEHQHIKELEEGGGNSRFRTDFGDIGKIYNRRDILNSRLQTLYRSQI